MDNVHIVYPIHSCANCKYGDLTEQELPCSVCMERALAGGDTFSMWEEDNTEERHKEVDDLLGL